MEEIIQIRKELLSLTYSSWVDSFLFTFKWWILVFLVLLMWIIWWKIVDKERFIEICFFGFIVALISTLLNSVGIELVLWGYPNQLMNIVKAFNILDLTIVPVCYMVIYQYNKKWSTYILFVFLFGLIGSFVGQPLFSYFELYQRINWEYIYSFPIYLFIGLLAKFLISRIITIQFKTL